MADELKGCANLFNRAYRGVAMAAWGCAVRLAAVVPSAGAGLPQFWHRQHNADRQHLV